MAVPLSTQDVRFYATTNQGANHSLDVPQMEAGFDAWLDRVKKEAAEEALAKALAVIDYQAAVAARGAHDDRYRLGRSDGLEFAGTLLSRVKNNAPAAALLDTE